MYQLLSQLVDGRVCVVMGDFNSNVDWETRNSCENSPLLEFVNDGFLTQWVKEPTRGDNILDLVLTTEDDIVKHLSVGEELGGSDHRSIRFDVQVPEAEIHTPETKKLDFRRVNFADLREGVAAMVLEKEESVENTWKNFKYSFR